MLWRTDLWERGENILRKKIDIAQRRLLEPTCSKKVCQFTKYSEANRAEFSF